jgi:hypothetical protein
VNWVTPVVRFEPRRVRIWMTPLAAREPYSDAAAAPFTTSMLSMSIDSRSAVDAPNAWLWITPSTTISGAFDLLMLVGVRSMMFVPLPGWPSGTMVTPATFP